MESPSTSAAYALSAHAFERTESPFPCHDLQIAAAESWIRPWSVRYIASSQPSIPPPLISLPRKNPIARSPVPQKSPATGGVELLPIVLQAGVILGPSESPR